MNLKKERNLLRQQMALLAEQSRDLWQDRDYDVSGSMCRIYKALIADRLRLGIELALVAHLLTCVFVQIEKFFRRKT